MIKEGGENGDDPARLKNMLEFLRSGHNKKLVKKLKKTRVVGRSSLSWSFWLLTMHISIQQKE